MENTRILAVDDEPHILSLCREVLVNDGFHVDIAGDATAALEQLQAADYDLVLTDMRMPGQDGLELIQNARQVNPALPIVLLTGYPSVADTVIAMRYGAQDVVTKPFDNTHLCQVVRRVLSRNRLLNPVASSEEPPGAELDRLKGHSPAMVFLRQVVAKVAPSDSIVLLQGEGGTGKELVARTLHDLSSRRQERFVAVDAAALNGRWHELDVVPGEDGGQAGDAFRDMAATGGGGTLFVDDVDELEPGVQASLLRFIDSGGDVSGGPRVMAASRGELKDAVASGLFRQDLYFCLNVIPIMIPALRSRPEDIAELAGGFLRELASQRHGRQAAMSDECLELLCRYSWPGNVRELRNVIERMVSMADDLHLTASDVPVEIAAAGHGDDAESTDSASFRQAKKATVTRFEKEYIHQLLVENAGNVTLCARKSQLNRSAFQRLMRKHGLRSQLYRTPVGGLK